MPKEQGKRSACQGSEQPSGCRRLSDWERLLAQLPAGWEARAREHRAFARRREVQSAGDLLRLVLGSAVHGWSQRLTAGWAEVVGIGHLSATAVRQRVQKARAWLSVEVGLLLEARRATLRGRSVRVRLVDATTVSEPGARGTTWRGHAVVDLESGGLCGLEVTDVHGAEGLLRHPLEPGEIAVADRAHARRADLTQIRQHGTEVVVRIGWKNLPLDRPEGGRLDLIGWLQTPITAPTERPVLVQTETGASPLRVIAVPLPPADAEAARRRCRQNARKKGRTATAHSVLAAGFVLLVTSLDEATWPCSDVLELYRCRWQIELHFKRLKRIWHLDHLRARDVDAAQTFILSIILAALLADSISRAAPIPLDAWLDDRIHPLSRWRWDLLWQDTVRTAICGPLDILALQRALPSLHRHLADSPRRRPLQAANARRFLHSHQEQLAA